MVIFSILSTVKNVLLNVVLAKMKKMSFVIDNSYLLDYIRVQGLTSKFIEFY